MMRHRRAVKANLARIDSYGHAELAWLRKFGKRLADIPDPQGFLAAWRSMF